MSERIGSFNCKLGNATLTADEAAGLFLSDEARAAKKKTKKKTAKKKKAAKKAKKSTKKRKKK